MNYVSGMSFKARSGKTKAQRKELYDALRALKRQYATVAIDPEMLTVPYIAGLFDAEGHIKMTALGSLSITLAQSSCPRMLESIRDKMASGTASRSEFAAYGRNAVAFLRAVDPYLKVKRDQCRVVLEGEHALAHFCKRKRGATDQQRLAHVHTMRKQLSQFKHGGAPSAPEVVEAPAVTFNGKQPTSTFIGVSKDGDHWRAQTHTSVRDTVTGKYHSKHHQHGRYATELDAARAVDDATFATKGVRVNGTEAVRSGSFDGNISMQSVPMGDTRVTGTLDPSSSVNALIDHGDTTLGIAAHVIEEGPRHDGCCALKADAMKE
jgi:hypothetical protein